MLTHAESYGGKSVWESEDAMELLEKILSGMTILYPDEKISKAAGKIQSEHSIGIVDSIIAATAIAHKLPLATLNLKHFKLIKGLKLFRLKN